VVPEMFDRVVGRDTGTVCDKIAVVDPNWLEPVFALLFVDTGTPRYDVCECLDGAHRYRTQWCHTTGLPMRVNFVVALLIATRLSVTTHCARSVP
jgi:hypothetical protein